MPHVDDQPDCLAFPDTNVLIHGRSIDQIPWGQILGCRNARVVISISLLEELDRKCYEASPPVKARARERRAALMKRKKRNDLALQDGSVLVFASERHGLRFQDEGLDSQSGDDRMIAETLASARRSSAVRHVLVTADATLQILAAARSIETVELGTEFEQPIEDETERENRKLKAELQRVTNRVPRLSVEFPNKTNTIEIRPPSPTPLSPPEIEEKLAVARAMHPPLARAVVAKPTPAPDGSALFVDAAEISEEEVDAYNRRLDAYFENLETGLRRGYFDETVSLELPMVLANRGSSPAERIVVTLDFPANVFVSEFNMTNTAEPGAPQLPTPPSPFFVFDKRLSQLPKPPEIFPKTGPKIDGATVEYRFERLDHYFERPLHLFAVFLKREDVGSFKIDYRLTSASIPRDVREALNVKLKK